MSSPRWPERSPAARSNDNGYVETDPTGRYGRFDELLGKGAMKSVYKGFDEVRGVEVAWNQANLADVLRTPDALQRMYSEVHLLSTLRHDSIIAFHASWVSVSSTSPRGTGGAGCGRTFNFITELFSSGTLRAYRLRYPRVSLRAVRGWARQILRGLAYLHAHDPPVIHRDLKCDNVFVNGHQGTVKIGDLGLAAVLRDTQTAHSVIGTPEFMAPEMYDEEYDELVDVYSFGMCMLEMLTVEFPYAECSNPAQIYRKVTSGKLPDAFYRVEDADARRFVGRCLVPASHRPSAQELLLDPFLSTQDTTMTMSTPPSLPALSTRSDRKDEKAAAGRTDMTITGKLNSDSDTIFLKVQITDESGHTRNIYFPFDIAGDTAIEVATEMVKELDIENRDPSEIAAMIEQEILRLVPDWAGGNCGDQQEYYTYADDDDNEEQPPFYYLSSSPTSSHGSHCGVGPTASGLQGGHGDWLQDYGVSSDDDDTSSTRSGLHYSSEEAQPEENPSGVSKTGPVKATRFGPGDSSSAGQNVSPHAGRPRRRGGSPDDSGGDDGGRRGRQQQQQQGRLTRNRSMVDVRSQLLHRTLVEELNKRMFFNTVGAVENIGFRRIPGYGGGPSSSSGTRTSSRGGGEQRGRRSGKENKHQFFMV
ncbi:probable serine/threonine-protein kinase WNK8 [Lolium perenne]|uniref:probable serine/threonine-protein kinase WNK8 n=1 Tax=Lolium perenne TaxID=4522 RepID=UPI0021EA1BE0|nr:probable serine/threonine-protein kinase WNK8 [Lolium perenne]